MGAFNIIGGITNEKHLLRRKALVMHEEKAGEGNARQLLTVFANLAKHTVVKGKVLIQSVISQLFLSAGASIACQKAV